MYLSRCRQHLFVGIILLILSNWTSLARAAKALTLEESIEIAKQANLSIQKTEERVKSAEAQVRGARAALLPNLSISSNYTYFKKLQKSVLEFSGGGFPGLPGAEGEMPLPGDTGGGAESNVVELKFGAHHVFQGTLALRQPIFAWGRYYYNHQSAKLNLEATRKDLDAAYNRMALR